jgi:hypothetical protein
MIAGNYDDRTVFRGDGLLGFVNVKFHPVQLAQQIVRELDVRLVDLIDQQDRLHVLFKGLPQRALDDVVADIVHAFVTQLGITQAGNRIVFIQALLSLGG